MSALKMVKNIENNQPLGRAVSRRFTRGTSAVSALALGATLVSGCGAVAGPEYTGEVGLELRGEVTSLDEDQADLVPALAFWGEDGGYLLDGEITGRFPTQFVMRVDQPPPEGALLSRQLDGSALEPGSPQKTGVAYLVLVAKDHPRTLSYEAFATAPFSFEVGEPDPETGKFTQTKTECSTDGERCETRVYECKTEPCETVLVHDRPLTDESVASNGGSCNGSSCLAYHLACDEATCSRTIAHCQLSSPADSFSSEGTVSRCTLQSRTGKAPGDGRIGSNFAQGLVVVFVSESAEWEGVHLDAGYNVLRPAEHEDKTAWAEALACRLNARAEVMKNPRDASEEELDARVEEAEEQCPQVRKFERLENPADHRLQISLGDAEQMF